MRQDLGVNERASVKPSRYSLRTRLTALLLSAAVLLTAVAAVAAVTAAANNNAAATRVTTRTNCILLIGDPALTLRARLPACGKRHKSKVLTA